MHGMKGIFLPHVAPSLTRPAVLIGGKVQGRLEAVKGIDIICLRDPHLSFQIYSG